MVSNHAFTKSSRSIPCTDHFGQIHKVAIPLVGLPLIRGPVEAKIMAAWRLATELAIESEDLAKLGSIGRSRSNTSFFAIGQALGVHHQTVQRCVERAVPLVRSPLS